MDVDGRASLDGTALDSAAEGWTRTSARWEEPLLNGETYESSVVYRRADEYVVSSSLLCAPTTTKIASPTTTKIASWLSSTTCSESWFCFVRVLAPQTVAWSDTPHHVAYLAEVDMAEFALEVVCPFYMTLSILTVNCFYLPLIFECFCFFAQQDSLSSWLSLRRISLEPPSWTLMSRPRIVTPIGTYQDIKCTVWSARPWQVICVLFIQFQCFSTVKYHCSQLEYGCFCSRGHTS